MSPRIDNTYIGQTQEVIGTFEVSKSYITLQQNL